MEAEYSLPQHTNVMNPIPEETQLRRLQPEPYASSAIYTELNYQVCIIFFVQHKLILFLLWTSRGQFEILVFFYYYFFWYFLFDFYSKLFISEFKF